MSQITKPTKAIKKSVADPSDSYHSLKPLWKKSRAVLQGQSNVKAHDEYIERDYTNLLIPFSPSMSQSQYDFYKSEAELPGLTAQYYNNMWLLGTPALSVVDPSVNFNWGTSTVQPLVGPGSVVLGSDYMSVRWSGYIMPELAETYTFYASADENTCHF